MRVVEAALDDRPDNPSARLAAAKALAEELAGEGCFLLSWKNALTGESYPKVEACGCDTLEGWELYAVTRGADLRVHVDEGDYEFMFIAGAVLDESPEAGRG
jgi:hypothetical protein